MASYAWKCHFDDNLECKNNRYCGTCEFQPDDDDKMNGKNQPSLIEWRTEYGITVPYCPSCGEMSYSADRCVFCGQRLIDNREEKNRKPRFSGVIERQEGLYCPKCGSNVEDTSKLVSHMDGMLEYGMSYMCECGHVWSIFFNR